MPSSKILESHRYREQTSGYQCGEGRGRDNIGVWEKEGYYGVI